MNQNRTRTREKNKGKKSDNGCEDPPCHIGKGREGNMASNAIQRGLPSIDGPDRKWPWYFLVLVSIYSDGGSACSVSASGKMDKQTNISLDRQALGERSTAQDTIEQRLPNRRDRMEDGRWKMEDVHFRASKHLPCPSKGGRKGNPGKIEENLIFHIRISDLICSDCLRFACLSVCLFVLI